MFATMLHVGKNIKTIRELANLTQLDFAKKFSVKSKKGEFSADKVYTYESDTTEPPLHILEDIAAFAGVTVDDLKNKVLKRGEIHFSDEENLTKDIFTGKHTELQDSDPPNYKTLSKPLTEAEAIEFLQQHIKDLRESNAWIKKMFEEMKERSEVNLMNADSDRLVIMAQLKNLTILAAEIFAAGDKKKYDSKMAQYRKLLGVDGATKT
jgi:transcriptional regulator with XRE-family HTH domain